MQVTYKVKEEHGCVLAEDGVQGGVLEDLCLILVVRGVYGEGEKEEKEKGLGESTWFTIAERMHPSSVGQSAQLTPQMLLGGLSERLFT